MNVYQKLKTTRFCFDKHNGLSHQFCDTYLFFNITCQGWAALDAGPATRLRTSELIQEANSIFWAGPLGAYELSPFMAATLTAMGDLVQATQRGATTIIGGGGTAAASHRIFYGAQSVASQITHASSGGGSSLVLMEGKTLPGTQYLSNREPTPTQLNSITVSRKQQRARISDAIIEGVHIRKSTSAAKHGTEHKE